ncbi:MAG: hypothetical protein LC750_09235 [Actinobacteria bacterium]|nr:hypothetical protein [Actinomycetota bacterium]
MCTPAFVSTTTTSGGVLESVADEAVRAASTRGVQLVVVAPTVASTEFTADDLVKVSVPIISMKAYEQDGLQMAGPTATVDHGTFSTDQVQVTLPHHPLAANLSGWQTITTTALPIGWVKLPAGQVEANELVTRHAPLEQCCRVRVPVMATRWGISAIAGADLSVSDATGLRWQFLAE